MNTAWRALGGSATGASHVPTRQGCQDSHGWLLDPPRVACFVVADGAGSRDRSATGAARAVEAVLDAVAVIAPTGRGPDAEVMQELFAAARSSLEALAEETSTAFDDYATTLAVALVAGGRVAIGQVGDSIVVYRTVDDLLVAASPAPRFEYANETVFLTSHEALASVRVDVVDDDLLDAIALSTDGLRFKILDDLTSGAPFGPFFADVFDYGQTELATSPAIARFIDGLEDQSGDDKTLVIAVKLPGEAATAIAERVVNNFLAEPPAGEAPPGDVDMVVA